MEVREQINRVEKSYSVNFPQTEDIERNIMINLIAQDIGPRLYAYFGALRIEMASNRYRIEIKQSE